MRSRQIDEGERGVCRFLDQELFVGQRHKWKPHCLGEIDCKRTDQCRFVGRTMLPGLIDEVVTANEAAVLYLWRHLYEVHCYPPERMSPSM